jgi:hypothetical protein
MNASLLNIVKSIVAEQGEGVLSEPRRISAFFSDLAKDEPKPQKNAFVKCLEHGFAQILKNAFEQDRPLCKQELAQRLHDEEGLDPALCADTLELLATVLFGEQRQMAKENQTFGSVVTNTPSVKTTVGAVKKNDLLPLKILSIIGLCYPFLHMLFYLIDSLAFRIVIPTIFYFGFHIAHFSLALVKGKKYNLKATRILAIIGIILFTPYYIVNFGFLMLFHFIINDFIYHLYLSYSNGISFVIHVSFYLVFSIVTLVELRKATRKSQTPYTPTE